MRPFSLREALLLLVVVAAGLGLLFAEPLFGDRCVLSMQPDDPRLGMAPWSHGDPRDLGAVNPITPDIDGFVLPGMLRARQLEDSEGAAYWDDSQLLGYALAANMPYPFDGPLTWLLPRAIERASGQALNLVTLLDIMLALHLALALMGAYRLCRKLDVEPAFAAVGALGFAFSAWMLTRWHVPQVLFTTAWWPLQATALTWMRRGFVRRGMLEGSLATGFLLLSGFPQVGMVLCLLTVFLGVADPLLRAPRRLAALALMLALGGGLAAPQLALNRDAYQGSLRADPTVQADTALRGLPPASLLGAVLPDAFGHPPDFSLPGAPAPTMESWLPQRLFWSHTIQNSVVENALYPGMLLLLLLPLMLARGVDRRARALLLAALLVLAGAMLAPLAVERWPALSKLAAGNVKRALVVVAAALPVAGALALQALGSGRKRVPWIWGLMLAGLLLAVPAWALGVDDPQAPAWAADLARQSVRQLALLVGCLIALSLVARLGRWLPDGQCQDDPPLTGPGFAPSPNALALAAWRHKDLVFGARWLRWAPALLLGFDLLSLAVAFNPFPKQVEPFPGTPSLELLARRPGRLATYGDSIALLPPTAAALHGIRSVHGVAPMVNTRVAQLLACIEGPLLDMRDPRVAVPFQKLESLAHPLLDLLGVDTVLHRDPGLAAATGWPVLFESESEGMAALQRPGAGPRAFWTGGAQVLADENERLARLADVTWQPHVAALLELAPERALQQVSALPMSPALVTSTAHRVQLSLEAPGPGVVVLTDAWDQGYSVTVDGNSVPLLRVDHALMGVEVDAGSHQIVFSYAPPGRRAGLAVAGVSLGLIGLLSLTVLRDLLRRRRGSDDAVLPAQPLPESLPGSDAVDPWAHLPEGFEPPGMPRVVADLGEFEGQGVTVIIPAYDDTPQLRRAIWSIRRTADLPFQLVIARARQSVAKNRNLGLSKARCDVVFFMDDDVLMPPGWTSLMLAQLAARKNLGALSSHLMFSDGSPQTRRPDLAPGEFWEITIPGTFFCFSSKRITGAFFDEGYLGSQWEDTDFMWQIQKQGLITGVTGDVCVVHDHNAAENKWLKQNGEYFFGKWHAWPSEDDTFSVSPEGYAAFVPPPLPGADEDSGDDAAPTKEWDARMGE